MNGDKGVTRHNTEKLPPPAKPTPGRRPAEHKPDPSATSTDGVGISNPTTAYTPTTVVPTSAAPRTTRTEQLTQPLVPQERLTQPLIPAQRLTQPLIPSERLTQPITPEQRLTQPAISLDRLFPSTPRADLTRRTEQLTQPLVTPENLTQPLVSEQQLTQRLFAPPASTQPAITQVDPIVVPANPVATHDDRLAVKTEPGPPVITKDDTARQIAARLEQLTAAIEAELKQEMAVPPTSSPPPADNPVVVVASPAAPPPENFDHIRQSLERLTKTAPPAPPTQTPPTEAPIIARQPPEPPAVENVRQSQPLERRSQPIEPVTKTTPPTPPAQVPQPDAPAVAKQPPESPPIEKIPHREFIERLIKKGRSTPVPDVARQSPEPSARESIRKSQPLDRHSQPIQPLTKSPPPAPASQLASKAAPPRTPPTQVRVVAKKPPEPPAAESSALRQSRPLQDDRKAFTEIRDLTRDSARSASAEAAQLTFGKTRSAFLAATTVSLLSSLLALAYVLTHFRVAFVGTTLLFAIAIVLACRFFVLRGRLAKYELTGNPPG